MDELGIPTCNVVVGRLTNEECSEDAFYHLVITNFFLFNSPSNSVTVTHARQLIFGC